MAKNLRPLTTNIVVLEKLAYVAPGTGAKFQDWLDRSPECLSSYDHLSPAESRAHVASFDAWCNEKTTEMKRLQKTLDFGFGEISEQARRMANTFAERIGCYPPAYTTTFDEIEVAALLTAQRITLPTDVSIRDLAGLHWS